MTAIIPNNIGFTIPGGGGAIGSYLTPDALMSYCAMSLQGLDTQVQTAFAQQQQANEISDAVSKALQPFSDNAAGFDPTKQGSASAMIGALQEQIDALPLGSEARQQLLAVRDAVANEADPSGTFAKILNDPQKAPAYFARVSATGDLNGQSDEYIVNALGGKPNTNTVSQQTVGGWCDTIKGIQSAVDSNSQLNMISLQSLMSQRQQAIQLCTNLVQSLGDQTNKIAENVGH